MGEDKARDKVTKRRIGKGESNMGRAQGPLAEEEGLYSDICVGSLQFLVTPLLMGSALLHSQDRFEEPLRPLVATTITCTRQILTRMKIFLSSHYVTLHALRYANAYTILYAYVCSYIGLQSQSTYSAALKPAVRVIMSPPTNSQARYITQETRK